MKSILFCGLLLMSGLAQAQSTVKDVTASKNEKMVKDVAVGATKGGLIGVASAESGLAGVTLFVKYIVKASGPIFKSSLSKTVFDMAVFGAKAGSLIGGFLALEGDLNAGELDQLQSSNPELTALRTQCYKVFYEELGTIWATRIAGSMGANASSRKILWTLQNNQINVSPRLKFAIQSCSIR